MRKNQTGGAPGDISISGRKIYREILSDGGEASRTVFQDLLDENALPIDRLDDPQILLSVGMRSLFEIKEGEGEGEESTLTFKGDEETTEKLPDNPNIIFFEVSGSGRHIVAYVNQEKKSLFQQIFSKEFSVPKVSEISEEELMGRDAENKQIAEEYKQANKHNGYKAFFLKQKLRINFMQKIAIIKGILSDFIIGGPTSAEESDEV